MNLTAIKQLIDDDIEIKITPAVERLRANVKRKGIKPKEPKPIKERTPKEFNYESFWGLVGAKQHAQFETKLKEIVFDRPQREAFYDKLIELLPDLSVDSFKPYFELYAAERKSFQQDYTPDELADLLGILTRSDAQDHQSTKYSAYDATAGTGSLIISKWHDDRIQETPWSYAPHRYFYRADELADNVIPYLLHNLAMRGMNAIVVHGDSLTREAKQIYFIQNSNDNYQGYSDINVLPHDGQTAREFSITKWLEPPIDHKESQEVFWDINVLPMRRKKVLVSNKPPKFETVLPWKDAPRMKDIAFVERAKKDKIYPKGSIIIQLSATKGQLGLLESDGHVETHHAVITPHYYFGIDSNYLFLWLQLKLPAWLHRVQEGLNVSLVDIKTMPVLVSDFKPKKVPIEYGQQSLF